MTDDWYTRNLNRREFRVLVEVNVKITDPIAFRAAVLDGSELEQGIADDTTSPVALIFSDAIWALNVSGMKVQSSGAIMRHYDEESGYYPPIPYPALPNQQASAEGWPNPNLGK